MQEKLEVAVKIAIVTAFIFFAVLIIYYDAKHEKEVKESLSDLQKEWATKGVDER